VADLELDLAPGLPPLVCNAGEINQAILNLLINAVHAVEAVVAGTGAKGSIRLATGIEAERLVLRVADSGCGIPERIRDQVFLPFFTTKPVGKGTGQGLAIVHSVVVRHGGSIEFTSEEGRGTVFTVRLPPSGVEHV
jgi:signal transduction histidine kinase